MLVDKKLKSKYCQKGMSMIELMISIALGLLVLAAATAMTVSSMVSNTDTLASARLNQDLDSVVQVMVNEIRRAGYSGGVFDFLDNEDINIVSNSCVLYSYDADNDGSLETTEKFGFKFVLVNEEIQMRTNCAASAVACATDCDEGTWVALTDASVVSITNLSFDSVNSKCISITDTANVVDEENRNNYWVTLTDGTTEFPCLATSGTDLTTWVKDENSVYASGGTFVAPASGDRLIGVRQVNVVVDGNFSNDSSMSKSEQVAISVRNNRVRTIP